MSGRIERLSLAAIRMAAGGVAEEPDAVAQWLYHFGTLPRSPAIERDFGPDDDPMAVLGMTVGGRARRLLEAAFDASSLAGWYSFARTGLPLQLASACKLYVSPAPEALADAFPRIAEVFAGSDLRSFKVGRGIEGLLRPDKIIAYFDDPSELASVAAALARALDGCPAQGAPFTAEAGGDGLLSSGIDPPLGGQAVSWRAWVTKRLAASLTAHRATPSGPRVVAVLADLRSEGVDPRSWLPTADAFQRAGVS